MKLELNERKALWFLAAGLLVLASIRYWQIQQKQLDVSVFRPGEGTIYPESSDIMSSNREANTNGLRQ